MSSSTPPTRDAPRTTHHLVAMLMDFGATEKIAQKTIRLSWATSGWKNIRAGLHAAAKKFREEGQELLNAATAIEKALESTPEA